MNRLPHFLSAAIVIGAAVSAVLFIRVNNAKKLLELQSTAATARAIKTAGELDTARQENQSLSAGLATANRDLTTVRENLAATEVHAKTLERDLAQANAKVAVYEQTTRALSDEIAGLKAELAETHATFASPEAVTAYKNTIAELERQLANARNGAAAPTAAGASTAVFASRPGRATILTVGPSSAFVVLNFGSARGAQLGQRLSVNHGTDVVATVLISDVRTNFSVAQVQPDTLRGVLQKGDLALLIR